MAYSYEYPYADMGRINLDWLLNQMRKLATEWDKVSGEFQSLNDAFNDLRDYVNNYFISSDFESLVDSGIQKLVDDGTITAIITAHVKKHFADDYGAVGDGVTDNYAILQNLLDTYGHINLDYGDYYCSQPLTGNDISITGMGMLNSRLIFNLTTSSAITCVQTKVPEFGCTFNDFAIINTALPANGTSIYGLVITGLNSILDRVTLAPSIRNVSIGAPGSNTAAGFPSGIFLENVNSATISGCSLVGCVNGSLPNVYTGSVGIHINGRGAVNAGSASTEIMIERCKAAYYYHAIYADAFEGLMVDECVLIACHYGIWVDSNSLVINEVAVTNTHINAYYCGLYSAAANGINYTIADNLVFIGEQESINPAYMINLESVNHFTIHDNIFYAARESNFGLRIYGHNFLIHDNEFWGYYTTIAYFGDTCTHGSVHDNRYSDAQFTNAAFMLDTTNATGHGVIIENYKGTGLLTYSSNTVLLGLPYYVHTSSGMFYHAVFMVNATLEAGSRLCVLNTPIRNTLIASYVIPTSLGTYAVIEVTNEAAVNVVADVSAGTILYLDLFLAFAYTF